MDSEFEDAEGKAKLRVAARMAALLKSLRLQTLLTGYDKGVMEEYGEINEDDVQADVMYMMIDLADVDGDLLGLNDSVKENGDDDGDTDENDGGPFVSLSKISINILSSPICGYTGAKGGR